MKPQSAPHDAGRRFEAETNREAFEVKLRRFLSAQDEAHQRRCRWFRRMAFGFLVPAAAVAYFGYVNRRDDDTAVIFFIVTAILLVVSLVFLFQSFGKHDELERARDVKEFYDAVRDDLHPRTVLKSRFDLTEATDGPAERSGTSPYSGAAKRWYRHPWLEMRWAFADGNLLRLELIDLVKTKSGSEIRREHQVKGLLRVSDDVYREIGAFQLSQLQAISRKTEGGWLIWFWGYLKTHDDLLPELKQIYRALVPRRSS